MLGIYFQWEADNKPSLDRLAPIILIAGPVAVGQLIQQNFVQVADRESRNSQKQRSAVNADIKYRMLNRLQSFVRIAAPR